jgi:hypothetical protein
MPLVLRGSGSPQNAQALRDIFLERSRMTSSKGTYWWPAGQRWATQYIWHIATGRPIPRTRADEGFGRRRDSRSSGPEARFMTARSWDAHVADATDSPRVSPNSPVNVIYYGYEARRENSITGDHPLLDRRIFEIEGTS